MSDAKNCHPTPPAGTPTLALCNNWTMADVTVTNTGNASALSNSSYGWFGGNYWYPYYTPICDTYRRPIRLTMAEVERLRVAAKRDKALRETLEKFTEHIEVIVDFGKAA